MKEKENDKKRIGQIRKKEERKKERKREEIMAN